MQTTISLVESELFVKFWLVIVHAVFLVLSGVYESTITSLAAVILFTLPS